MKYTVKNLSITHEAKCGMSPANAGMSPVEGRHVPGKGRHVPGNSKREVRNSNDEWAIRMAKCEIRMTNGPEPTVEDRTCKDPLSGGSHGRGLQQDKCIT